MMLAVLRYRLRFRVWPKLLRWTVCAARGHRLGQTEWYPVKRHGKRWGYHRPCKRCRLEIGCSYEPMRGIYEYEPGYRHDGDYGIDMLLDEAMEAQSAPAEGEKP